MTIKPKTTAKIIAISLLLIAAGFLGFYTIASKAIHPAIYEQQILGAIKIQTGLDAKIDGNVQVALFPMPRLIINGLEIGTDANQPPATPRFTIEKVEISIAPSSVFSDNVRLSSVAISRPILSLERAKDGDMNWGWLNGNLLKTLSAKNWGDVLSITLANGEIKYQDSYNDQSFALENIGLSGVLGTHLSLKGTSKLNKNEQKLSFTIDNNANNFPHSTNVSADNFPLNFAIYANNKNYLNLKSVISTASNTAKILGEIKAQTDDLERFLPEPPNHANKNEPKNEAKIALPMLINGSLSFANGAFHFSDLSLDGMNSKATGSADIYWENWYPTIAADLSFSTLDYPMWKQLMKNRIGENKNAEKPKFGDVQNYDFRKENPIPQNIELDIHADAQKVIDGKQEWGKSRLDAVLEGGAITVNQCDISLDGGGQMSFFGVLSQGGAGELRFQGNVEAKGKSLKKTIAMFNNSASDLPEIGLGEFSTSGNLYIAKNQLNFSEATATIEGAKMAGEIISYLDEDPHVEAKVRIEYVNFDAVRDALRKQKAENEKSSNSAQNSVLDYGLSFKWLKSLKTQLNAKIFVDNFTFMEKKGGASSLSLSAYDGVLKLDDMQLKYPDSTTAISFNLNMKNILPAVSLAMNADQINTNYFDLDGRLKTATTPEIPQSEKNISFEWMDKFNGVFDIKVNKLINRNVVLNKFKMQARVDEKKMQIQKLSLIYSQAQTEVTGTLYGGKIPGVSARFTMENADLYELINSLLGLTNISGYANVSGTITTSGNSLKNWLAQMDAKFLLSARNVRVNNVNLAGVNNIVSVSRSSADVVNNVNNAFSKGSTEFSADGSLSIFNGEMRIPAMALKSGTVTGNMVGGINLSTMMLQLSAIFGFNNLSKTSPPTMIVQMSGALDQPDMKVDTSALEAYVAKRAVKEK